MEEENLNKESGFTLKTMILASSAIAVGVIIIILLIVAICASCSNKTYTPTNTTSSTAYTPPITTTTQDVVIDDSSNDWATLYVSDSWGGLVVLDYRDPDTGVHYLYFWKQSTGEIEITPRLADSNGTIMQD
jgi:hypothetical protein